MQNKTLSICILFTFSRRDEKDFDFSKSIVQIFLKFLIGFYYPYAHIKNNNMEDRFGMKNTNNIKVMS